MVASLTGASLLAGPDGFSRAAVGRSLSLLGSCRRLQRDENIRQHATRGERWPPPLHRHTFTAETTNWAARPANPPFLAAQKSGLSARGTSASFPEYHWMFSEQASSCHSFGLIR